jgi:hypothetical protein
MQRHRCGANDDRTLLAQVARFAHIADAEMVCPATVEAAAAAMTGVTVALGCRLHGLLLAYLSGARIVAVSSSGEVAESFAGAPGATLLAEPCDVDAATDAVLTAVTSSEGMHAERRRHVQARCDDARRHLRTVALHG